MSLTSHDVRPQRVKSLLLPPVPEALKQPGMYMAIYRIAGAPVADAASRWRNLGADVSLEMCARVRAVIPKAEQLLKAAYERRVVHGLAQARLRRALHGLSHERSSRPMTPTLRQVAERAGINYQTLVNFRSSDRPMSHEPLKRLAKAMRELGLLPKAGKAGKAGTKHGLKPELQTMKEEHDA
jgi:transcriptional regulator with XRE-family HTH domain